MAQSEAERQLVVLLRGLDVPEFSLQISIREKRSDPLLVGGRGWHLLENPRWIVTMVVPQLASQALRAPGSCRNCGGAPPENLRRPALSITAT